MLEETLGRMHTLMAMYGSQGAQHPESQELVNREHAALIDAIAARDAGRARAAATTHLQRIRDTRIVAMLQGS